jgi:hypothetical protein
VWFIFRKIMLLNLVGFINHVVQVRGGGRKKN